MLIKVRIKIPVTASVKASSLRVQISAMRSSMRTDIKVGKYLLMGDSVQTRAKALPHLRQREQSVPRPGNWVEDADPTS